MPSNSLQTLLIPNFRCMRTDTKMKHFSKQACDVQLEMAKLQIAYYINCVECCGDSRLKMF